MAMARRFLTSKEYYDQDWEGILDRGEEYKQEIMHRKVEGFDVSKLWLELFYRRRDVIVFSIAGPLMADGWSVLDIGCGVSILARIVDEVGKDARVTGIDISTSVLEENGKRWPDHVWLEGDAADPEVEGQFDLILSTEILEHLPDRVGALGNWFKLVRPGGYCIITTPTPTLKIPDGPHLGFESLGTIKKVMRRNGVDLVRAYGIGLFLPLQAKKILSLGDIQLRNRLYDFQLKCTYRLPTLADDVVYLGRKRT